ncbi:MAG: ion channel [Ornithinimicrobium sp.]
MTRLEKWEGKTRSSLMVLALVFLVVYAIPIVAPRSPELLITLCRTTQDLVWVIFAADYGVRLIIAEHRLRFVRRNLIDLAAVTMPALRPLRLVSALLLIQQQGGQKLRGHVATYVAVSIGLVVSISGLAVLDAERGAAGGNISTWQDALWWALVTVTTVGYGDFYPVTGEGRLFALGLMLCGIALLGIVTASLSSWLLEKVADSTEKAQAATARDITALAETIEELRHEVRQLRKSPG